MSQTLASRLEVVVAAVEEIATDIREFHLVLPDGAALPPFSAGAHILVRAPSPDETWRNAYSLTGPSWERHHYTTSVQRNAEGRGGSRYLHDRVRAGDRLHITPPVNLFPIAAKARKHLLIAGGIGITPLLAMAAELHAQGRNFALHYAARDRAAAAHAEALAKAHGERVTLHLSSEGRRLPIADLCATQPLGTHLFVCGPERLIDAVLAAARTEGWPQESLHAERFLAAQTGAPFAVRLRRSGRDLTVDSDQSLLEALEAAGLDIPYLCRAGVCGRCLTPADPCGGTILHADRVLTETERNRGDAIIACVSRFQGERLVLDL